MWNEKLAQRYESVEACVLQLGQGSKGAGVAGPSCTSSLCSAYPGVAVRQEARHYAKGNSNPRADKNENAHKFF